MRDVEKIESLQDNLIKETDEDAIYSTIDKIIEYKETDNSVENTLLVLNKKLGTFRLILAHDNSIREKNKKYFMYNIHKAFENLISTLETQKEDFEVRRLTNILVGNHFLSDYNYTEYSIHEVKTYKCFINGIWLPNLLELMYWSDSLIETVEKITPYIECRM